MFLGLRVLHAESLIEALGAVRGGDFDHWRDYFGALIDQGRQLIAENGWHGLILSGGNVDLDQLPWMAAGKFSS